MKTGIKHCDLITLDIGTFGDVLDKAIVSFWNCLGTSGNESLLADWQSQLNLLSGSYVSK